MFKYYIFLWVSLTLGRLPGRFLYPLAMLIGETAFLVNWKVRARVYHNMRQVLGPDASAHQIRDAVRGVFHYCTYYYCDLVRFPYLRATDIDRHLVIHDYEHITAAHGSGRGVILASAHYGNPEYALQALAARGFCITALTEPLQPRAISVLFDGWRSRFGHRFLPVGLSSIKAAIRTLRSGGMVAILCDRDLQPTGVVVPFCGKPAKMPVGAVDMALRTDAVIVPVLVRRLHHDRFEAFVQPPLDLVRTDDREADIRTNVRALLARFEPALCRDPKQWIVLERVWDGVEESPDTESVRLGSA